MISDFDEEIIMYISLPGKSWRRIVGLQSCYGTIFEGGGETFDLVKLTMLRQGTILTRPHLFYYLIKLFKI